MLFGLEAGRLPAKTYLFGMGEGNQPAQGDRSEALSVCPYKMKQGNRSEF